MYFAKNIGRYFSKNTSKNLTSKYHQKILDRAKQSATDALKTASKRAIRKTAEATGDLIEQKMIKELQEFQKFHQRIIQKQIKKKKCLEKDIYL